MSKFYSFILVAVCLLSFTFSSGVAHAAAPETRTITVDGRASFHVVPDKAIINIGVESTGKNAVNVSTENAVKTKAIINAFLAQGIKAEQIKTASYNFYPLYNDKNIVNGYRAENNITVSVNDVNMVGKIIDTAIAKGASDISGIHYTLHNENKYKDRALREAVREAEQQAKVIATTLNKKVVNVVSVQAGNVYVENYRPENTLFRATAATTTPVKVRDVKVSAQVNVVFEMN